MVEHRPGLPRVVLNAMPYRAPILLRPGWAPGGITWPGQKIVGAGARRDYAGESG